MTVQQLIDALEEIQDKTKRVEFDDGYETWSIDRVAEKYSSVFICY
jgi:hypothetical protein